MNAVLSVRLYQCSSKVPNSRHPVVTSIAKIFLLKYKIYHCQLKMTMEIA